MRTAKDIEELSPPAIHHREFEIAQLRCKCTHNPMEMQSSFNWFEPKHSTCRTTCGAMLQAIRHTTCHKSTVPQWHSAPMKTHCHDLCWKAFVSPQCQFASAGTEMLCKTVLPKTEIGEIGFDKIEKNIHDSTTNNCKHNAHHSEF